MVIIYCDDFRLALDVDPVEVSSVNAALRPQRGKPKEEAETQLEILWQSEDCFLDHRVEEMAMLPIFEDLHCMLYIYIYVYG